MKSLKKHPMQFCWILFLICVSVRILEYFFIRTDETFLAENFIHKLFGIVLVTVILFISGNKWSDIGFVKEGAVSKVGKGLLLGAMCFTAAYIIEGIILYLSNGNVELRFYASGFSLNGEMAEQTGFVFVLLCIAFNMINVWMEEGFFRGLLTKILEEKPYRASIFFIAFLFGIWHWVMPFRDYIEGKSSLGALLVLGIGYIILAGIMSLKWSMLYNMTGSLWMGAGDHLFNNVVVTNLLHVVSNNEADSMQIVRVLIGQLLSFAVVLAYYKKRKKNLKK